MADNDTHTRTAKPTDTETVRIDGGSVGERVTNSDGRRALG